MMIGASSMSQEDQLPFRARSRIQPIVEIARTVNGEQVLFWGFLIVAGSVFITAAQFSPAARLFPRLAAGVILIAGMLRLVSTHLNIVPQQNESTTFNTGESSDSNESENEPEMGENLSKMLIFAGLITGYILGGYFIGLFWVTPLFVVLYMITAGQAYWKSALWTIGLTGVAYGFMTIMKLDITGGAF